MLPSRLFPHALFGDDTIDPELMAVGAPKPDKPLAVAISGCGCSYVRERLFSSVAKPLFSSCLGGSSIDHIVVPAGEEGCKIVQIVIDALDVNKRLPESCSFIAVSNVPHKFFSGMMYYNFKNLCELIHVINAAFLEKTDK